MAKTQANLQTKTARLKLKPRASRYFEVLGKGVSISYMRKAGKAGTFGVRYADDMGKEPQRTIGEADDLRKADGVRVFTYEQARDKALEIAGQKELSATEMTLHAALDAWLAGKSYTMKKSKLTTASSVRRIQAGFPAHLRLRDVTKARLVRWRDAVAEERTKDTANRYFKNLRAACRKAVGKGVAGPWDEVAPLKVTTDGNAPRALTPEEEAKLLRAAEPCLRAFLTILFATGARPSEAGQLKVSDFLDNGSLRFRASVAKTRQERIVVLDAATEEMLRNYVSGRAKDEWLLPRADGLNFAEGRYEKPFKAALAKAKLPADFTPYNLRDSHITRLLLNGAPVVMLAQRVGNSAKMIEKHYAAFTENDVRRYL